MLEDNQIKIIVSAMNSRYEEIKKNHLSALAEIQKLCQHSSFISVMAGNRCEICGKFLSEEDRRIRRFVQKDINTTIICENSKCISNKNHLCTSESIRIETAASGEPNKTIPICINKDEGDE